MSRWNPVADRVFNDSGFPSDHDRDSDKQEPDSLVQQSVKSGKSAAEAEKSSLQGSTCSACFVHYMLQVAYALGQAS